MRYFLYISFIKKYDILSINAFNISLIIYFMKSEKKRGIIIDLTKSEKYYGKIVERYASKNFNVGDRVKSYYNKEWFLGTVVDKYKKVDRFTKAPYILIKTDKKVESDPDAFLGGFGLEGRVDSPGNIFENETDNEISKKTSLREKTQEEKDLYDNLPF